MPVEIKELLIKFKIHEKELPLKKDRLKDKMTEEFLEKCVNEVIERIEQRLEK